MSEENVVERRRFVRFQVRSPAFVFKSYQVGRIVDVSMDGLAFTYDGAEKWPQDLVELDLLINDEVFLAKVPIRVVSDHLVSGPFTDSDITTRQCGIQFGKLSADQLLKLEYFVRANIEESTITWSVENLMGSLGYD